MRRIAATESNFGTHPNTYRSGYDGGIWQVDRIGFLETQSTSSHPGLARKHALIKEKLGIDWSTVTYSDLRKPLYSALAARQVISNWPRAIPDTVDGQANEWKTYYNTEAGAGTVKHFIDNSELISGDATCSWCN